MKITFIALLLGFLCFGLAGNVPGQPPGQTVASLDEQITALRTQIADLQAKLDALLQQRKQAVAVQAPAPSPAPQPGPQQPVVQYIVLTQPPPMYDPGASACANVQATACDGSNTSGASACSSSSGARRGPIRRLLFGRCR